MNWIRRHPFLTLLIGFGLLLLVVGYELLSTYEDLRLITRILNGELVVPPPPGPRAATSSKYRLAILKGLSVSPDVDTQIGRKIGTSWEKDKHFLPMASVTAELLASGTDRASHLAALLPRLTSSLTDLPSVGSQPEFPVLSDSPSGLREIRALARYWCLLAQEQAWSGNRHDAWLTALGPLLLAQHLEVGESTEGGVSLLVRTISIMLRKMATMTLAELAPQLDPDRALASQTFALMAHFEKRQMPIREILALEARHVLAFAKSVEHAFQSGTVQKTLGNGPSLFTRRLIDPETIKRHFDPVYEPVLQACEEPYLAAKVSLKRSEDIVNEIVHRFGNLRASGANYLVNPTQYVFDFLFSMGAPNFARALEQEFSTQQAMRGTGITYVLYAYHREHQRWPKTLAEAETWFGTPFPLDRFTDAPMLWSVDASGTPQLTSVGPDLATGTNDDLEFFPDDALTASP